MPFRRFLARMPHGVTILVFILLFGKFAKARDPIPIYDSRLPSLYTQDFSSCMKNSSVAFSQFGASYYRDNSTAVFDFQGNTLIVNDTATAYISIHAYGEHKFKLSFNPCGTAMKSVPVSVNELLPLFPKDVSTIKSITYTVPDFEGQAILRIFSNTTGLQIGCEVAVVTNGYTFRHPRAVGSIVTIFLILGLASSLALAIYGDDPVSNRTHYAHGPSVFVALAVLHHVYFTGVLSLDWPSVLVAFWSNFAWFGGMIYSEKMQNSINRVSRSRGNPAPSSGSDPLGFDTSTIYRRNTRIVSYSPHKLLPDSGLPQPGNNSNFAGTLAQEGIPVSNAFLTGLVWFMVALVVIPTVIGLVKATIEVLASLKLIRTERLETFRMHWMDLAAAAVGRAFFIGGFMLIFLVMFEFTLPSSFEVRTIAVFTFLVLLGTMGFIMAYPIVYRLRNALTTNPYRRDRLYIITPSWTRVPLYFPLTAKSPEHTDESLRIVGSIPWFPTRCFESFPDGQPVHMDKYFVAKAGWLTARFRFQTWWFYSVWILFEFIKACIMAGTRTRPDRQVVGVLVMESISVLTALWFRPFESTRINMVMVYLLGLSKVFVSALLLALLPRYNNSRVIFTIIGIVIIVIQGLLILCLLVSMFIGFITTFMSLTHHKERPSSPDTPPPMREKYFHHLEATATGITSTSSTPPPSTIPSTYSSLRAPGFQVSSVRRFPKIGDETNPPHEEENSIELVTLRNVAALGGAPPPTALEFSRSMNSIRSYGALTNPFAGRCGARESLSANDRVDLRSGGRRESPEGMVVERWT